MVLVNVPSETQRIQPSDYQAVMDVLDEFSSGKGALSGFYRSFRGGEHVQKFEEEFAKYIGVKHAIAVTSGTAALHTAIEAALGGRRIGAPTGLPILTSPYTFAASATSILMALQEPRFCDISPKTLNMDPTTYETSVKAYWTQPKIVIAVHFLGQPMNLEQLHNRFPKAIIIEDCAQALGATIRNRKVGGLSDLGCFSFQETKTLTTLGEGGMITTNDDKLAEFCRNIRNHGEKYGGKPYLGYNYRMTEAAAAFGLSQLRRLDQTLQRQIECAKIVRENMPEWLTPLETFSTTKAVFFIVAGLMKKLAEQRREEWVKKAQEKLFNGPPRPGKTIGLGYTELVPDLPIFQQTLSLPVAREMIHKTVWFDIHRFTSPETVRARMDALREVEL